MNYSVVKVLQTERNLKKRLSLEMAVLNLLVMYSHYCFHTIE